MASDALSLRLVSRWLLPVGAGVVLGSLVRMPSGAKPETTAPTEKVEAKVDLEDEPTKVKLAALAGRTTEARAKVAALIASGAKDEEIAEWLAPILIADPAALPHLVEGVPAERRTGLARLALRAVVPLNPDSVWEVIRATPFAAEAARANDGDPNYPGLEIIGTAANSRLAAEVLCDPANGFSNEEVAKYFEHGTRNEANARKILEEWIAGRWGEGEPPPCVRSAWSGLRWRNEPELRTLEQTLPDSLKKKVSEFDALAKIYKRFREISGNPPAEEFSHLGGKELASVAESRGMAGTPLPLDLLAALPEEKRGKALGRYFQWSYPFSLESARQAISHVDELPFSRAEKDDLFRQASEYEWNSQGDLGTALALAARIADDKIRAEVEAGILEELAQYDPRGALAHVQQMPEGELRDKIEKLATESLP